MPLVVVVVGWWCRILASGSEFSHPFLKMAGFRTSRRQTAVSRKGQKRREVQSQAECKAAEIRGGSRVGKESECRLWKCNLDLEISTS